MKLKKQWIWMSAVIGLVIQVQGQEMNPEKTFFQIGEPSFFESTDGVETSPQPALPSATAAAATRYKHGEPTDQEQYMLELVNRARANPLAEVERLGMDNLNEGLEAGTLKASPRPPLAFHPFLFVSARAHSRWMLKEDTFSHQGVGGSRPWDRAKAAGYPGTYVGENIAWMGSTGSIDINKWTESLHDSLFKSPGHRVNILNENYDEIGIGIEEGLFTVTDEIPVITYNALMGTQNFASSETSLAPYVTGVVYIDKNGNQFYDPGEGVPNIVVSLAAGQYYAVTSSSGGYSFPYTGRGVRDILFEGTPLKTTRKMKINLNIHNVKRDLQIEEEELVKPTLTWSHGAEKLILTFTGKLESSSDLIHWEELPSSSPCEIPLTTPMKYYRSVN